ncbi:hypothetical protein DAEQUDRAFT_725070 [Daedalea quercina L-15889]|uniref:DUF6533 domain-containing protein n=1 Tax=Daedalea quercina L-15889 TaxID=1314783 RepID=A0A165RBW9_9APHY|nr:hypothetical protein DAEQUDRAFT_725070 [Daedalea quercina L-15889]
MKLSQAERGADWWAHWYFRHEPLRQVMDTDTGDGVDDILRLTCAQFLHSRTEPVRCPSYTINYCRMAPAALSLYDYILTFGDEVQYIWGKRLCFASIYHLDRVTMSGCAFLSLLGVMSWYTLVTCVGRPTAELMMLLDVHYVPDLRHK